MCLDHVAKQAAKGRRPLQINESVHRLLASPFHDPLIPQNFTMPCGPVSPGREPSNHHLPRCATMCWNCQPTPAFPEMLPSDILERDPFNLVKVRQQSRTPLQSVLLRNQMKSRDCGGGQDRLVTEGKICWAGMHFYLIEASFIETPFAFYFPRLLWAEQICQIVCQPYAQ